MRQRSPAAPAGGAFYVFYAGVSPYFSVDAGVSPCALSPLSDGDGAADPSAGRRA